MYRNKEILNRCKSTQKGQRSDNNNWCSFPLYSTRILTLLIGLIIEREIPLYCTHLYGFLIPISLLIGNHFLGTYHFNHSFMHRVQTFLKSLISLIYDNQYVPIYNNNNNTYYVLRNNNNMPKQKYCCCSKKVVLGAINHAHIHSSTHIFWHTCHSCSFLRKWHLRLFYN